MRLTDKNLVGLTVVTADGQALGEVSVLFIDSQTWQVEALQVKLRRAAAELPEPTLTIAAGQIERWRVVNASSARYVRLSIGGRPFTILGTTGGLLDAPVQVTEVLLVPAGRVDVAVGPFAEGETIQVESLKYHRGTIARSKGGTFATVRGGAAAFLYMARERRCAAAGTFEFGDGAGHGRGGPLPVYRAPPEKSLARSRASKSFSVVKDDGSGMPNSLALICSRALRVNRERCPAMARQK